MTKRIGQMALAVWILIAAGIARTQGQGATDLKKQLTVDLGQGVKMDFVLIPPGIFAMGSGKGTDDEKPLHPVTITKPFYLGIYEVTQAQWKALMDQNVSSFKGDDQPVENVSWDECQRFLTKFKEKLSERLVCRLPTEAEWEYACRAGSKTEYCFGDQDGALGDYAWSKGNSEKQTHPVGQKKPNAWHLYDMHGNVWEWCQDWYDEGYYAKSSADDPTGPASGSTRVLRGGSYYDVPYYTRSATRWSRVQDYHYYLIGFRVACVPQR